MFWKENRLTIWVAIVCASLLLAWMVTWDFEPGVGEPRPGPTVPDWVNPRVTSTTLEVAR
jgi:hypothetical protein